MTYDICILIQVKWQRIDSASGSTIQDVNNVQTKKLVANDLQKQQQGSVCKISDLLSG